MCVYTYMNPNHFDTSFRVDIPHEISLYNKALMIGYRLSATSVLSSDRIKISENSTK